MAPEEAREMARLVGVYRDELRRIHAEGQRPPAHLDPQVRAARAAVEAAITARLGEPRAARLKRLSWRIRGAEALGDEEVASALGLDAAQRTAVAQAITDGEAELRGTLREIQAVRLSGPVNLQELAASRAAAGQQRLLAVLRAAQRDAFRELQQDHPDWEG